MAVPDPEDRHVLAAAISGNAHGIVTCNLTDFPPAALPLYDIEAKHPGDFLLESLDLATAAVTACLVEQAAALRNPPRTVGEVLDTLRELGLVRTVARFRELLGGRRGESRSRAGASENPGWFSGLD